jgi:HSP20 family protein
MFSLFDSIFDTTTYRPLVRHSPAKWPSKWEKTTDLFGPAADVTTLEDGTVQIQLDVPGVEKDNISIWTEDRTLVIRGSRKLQNASVRWSGDFERRYRTARNLNLEAIQATLVDGVLTVLIPQLSDAAPNKIEIQ